MSNDEWLALPERDCKDPSQALWASVFWPTAAGMSQTEVALTEAVLPITKPADGKPAGVRNEVHIRGDVSPSVMDAMCAMLERANNLVLRSMRERTEAMAWAGRVTPSDTNGVLAAYREDPALIRPKLRATQAQLEKPARTLPGALSEASGGHRLGGWGASE